MNHLGMIKNPDLYPTTGHSNIWPLVYFVNVRKKSLDLLTHFRQMQEVKVCAVPSGIYHFQ